MANGQLRIGIDVILIPGYERSYLIPHAAHSFAALAREFAREFGGIPRITDSYRPYAIQEKIFLERFTTSYVQGSARRVTWRGRTWYLRRGQPAAAVPGTSNHGGGTALDLGSWVERFGTRQHDWMKRHAPAYGWSHPRWARRGGPTPEPWHWEHDGQPRGYPAINAPETKTETPPPIIPIEERSEKVLYVKCVEDGNLPFLMLNEWTGEYRALNAARGHLIRKLESGVVNTPENLREYYRAPLIEVSRETYEETRRVYKSA